MGVHGLWQILEPAGRPVDPHSLRGKILAVDASIWLHQLVKGFRDKDGNPVPNAHILGVFFRVCKLLSYGVKPIFVFDGGVPVLKRQTMAGRRSRKLEALDKSEVARQKLLSNYIRQQLQRETRKVLPSNRDLEELEEIEALESNYLDSRSPTKKSNSASPTKQRVGERFDEVDLELLKFREKFALTTEMDVDRVDRTSFKRGDIDEESSSEGEEDEWSRRYGMDYAENFSTITSKDFDVLPLETQHEILFEMQESRKMNSWAKMDAMPSNLQDFSSYQMDRLVKRRFLQKKIQSVQQEMGQRHIHVQNLDELLKMDYNFGHDKVVGSQEKGFVLVKKSPHKDNSISRSNTSSESGTATAGSSKDVGKRELHFDLVEHNSDDSDTDNDKVSEQKTNNVAPSTSAGTLQVTESHQSIPDLEEEQQMTLAIQLSLMEQVVDVTSGGPAKQIQSTDDRDSNANTVLSHARSSAHVMPSSSDRCSKFLDTVGFSSKVKTVTSSSSLTIGPPNPHVSKPSCEISSDSDDDDFEDVPENGVDRKLREQKITGDADCQEYLLTSENSSSTPLPVVASINIADVVSKVSTEGEDDIFADLFQGNNITDDARPGNVQNVFMAARDDVSSTSPSHSQNADGINWDSDPDVELIESLELGNNSKSNNDKRSSVRQSTVPVVSRSASTSGTVSTADTGKGGNQHINRTLGRLPQQSAAFSNKVTMITAEYMQAQEKLNADQSKLQSAKGFQERVATSISDQISVETQELLGLFGIPYIVSKMEAESQCAFLDAACLTDGTITDDSDAWLFGSQRVYKNFYSAGNRPITFYQLADITKRLGLDRDKLVLIAMLSGGDYSDGIPGVGPVTALEILAEFPTNELIGFDALLKFREWWDLINDSDVKAPSDLSKSREKLRKLKLRPGFPNEAVYQAYMNPTIDNSTESFRWGTPNIEAIRAYAEKKFGWDQTKCDSMLLPVMKYQTDKSKQPTLDSFLVSSRYDLDKQSSKRKRGSKRLQTAFKKLRQSAPVSELALSAESSSDEDDHKSLPPSQSKTLRKKSAVEPAEKEEDESSDEDVPTSPITINQNNHAPPVVKNNTDDRIPQKVQRETNQSLAKKKAIDVFKKLKKTQ